MRCARCGAEWTMGVDVGITNCPFCGEALMGSIPYQQAVDALRIIIERFGVNIYYEGGRLYGLINDLLPNTSKEKNILKTAIALGAPEEIARVITDSKKRNDALKRGYDLLEDGGLSKEWCSASLFIFTNTRKKLLKIYYTYL